MSQPLEVSDPAEGHVDWKGAGDYLTGKSADGEPAAGEEPKLKKFKYRGKEVEVDADTYGLLEEIRRDARGQNGRLGSELGQARERLARLEAIVATREQPAATRPALTPPDPLLATRDIAAWQREYDAYNAAQRELLKTELEEKYLGHVREVQSRVESTQRETQWADAFYATYDYLDHPDLKPTVAQVYTEHEREILALKETDPEQAAERLAELVDKRLHSIRTVGREGAGQPTTTRPPRFESSAGAAPRSQVEAPPREFSASSWVARQRLLMSGRAVPKEK